MYKVKEILIVDVMERCFQAFIKVNKKAYNFYTNETLFGGRRNREAFKIVLDANEYSKLFDLSIKKEYKAHEYYIVHIRDIVKWQIFENSFYKKSQNTLFNDIVIIYINKELDISFLEIYVTNKAFINKLNSMLSISQTNWKRKINLNKRERNYLYRLNTLKAFNNGYDQFADRRTQNDIIKDLNKCKEDLIYAEDLMFLTGDESEVNKISERIEELKIEWDNLVYTDKQYEQPIKRYMLNKHPKTYRKRTTHRKLIFDKNGMLK
jgi:hypothetical protein